MTPKEKARGLYNLMYSNNSHPFNVQVRKESAKQCALIAVDELIQELTGSGIVGSSAYWKEVKQEIENL